MPGGILQRIRQMTEVPVADSDPVVPQLRLPLTVLLLAMAFGLTMASTVVAIQVGSDPCSLGEIFRQGAPESLSSDAEVRRIYLGETFNLN